MNQPNQIRTLALGLIRDGDRTFLSEGYDPVSNKPFIVLWVVALTLVKPAMTH